MKRRIRTDSGVCGPLGLGRLWSGSASRKLAAALGWGGVDFGFAGGFCGLASAPLRIRLASAWLQVWLTFDWLGLASALLWIAFGSAWNCVRINWALVFVLYGLVWACFGFAGDRAWVGLELSCVGLGVSLVVLCVGLGLDSRCVRLGSCRLEIR